MTGPPSPLEQLYPAQKTGKHSSAVSQELLELSVGKKAEYHQQVSSDFFGQQGSELVAAAQTIADCYRLDGRMLTMGNGGSSCDAAHLAVEFLHPVTTGRPALGAINLCADIAMLTAVGNDVGQADIFVRQVIAHGRQHDCLIGFSTSGNSANLIRAFAKGKELGLKTIGFSGGDGGAMAQAGLDHLLNVPTASIHRVQECHLTAYHIIWDLVHSLLANDRHPAKGAGK